MPSKKAQNSEQNRPTDPFGGPPRGRNSISLAVTVVALVIIILVQWTRGDLGNLLGGAAPPPAEATAVQIPTVATQQSAETQVLGEAKTPVAQAKATTSPTKTPKATNTPLPKATKTPRPSAAPTATANSPPKERASNLTPVIIDDLPVEAQETVGLIDQGGPFPYSRDGIVFENREHILPNQPKGYYHEYTVITPNSNDRGARRVVTGEEGEMYYSDDHYNSFREIVR